MEKNYNKHQIASRAKCQTENLAAITHRPGSFYIREAFSQYMDDLEDKYISLERITSPNRKLLTTQEVLKDLQ